jgi:hypothetical protein
LGDAGFHCGTGELAESLDIFLNLGGDEGVDAEALDGSPEG